MNSGNTVFRTGAFLYVIIKALLNSISGNYRGLEGKDYSHSWISSS